MWEFIVTPDELEFLSQHVIDFDVDDEIKNARKKGGTITLRLGIEDQEQIMERLMGLFAMHDTDENHELHDKSPMIEKLMNIFDPYNPENY